MKNCLSRFAFLWVISCFLINNQSFAKSTMPVLFSDNMVLQQKTQAPVWGNCKPEKKVKVKTSWDEKIYETLSDKSGNWILKVETPEAGGPYRIIVDAGEKITLDDVMIGEVWLCSGQSNMEMPLAGWGRVENSEAEIADANHPNIRLFQVEKTSTFRPVSALKVMGNSWLECSPATIPEFSATAYFFAVNLSKILNNIPIGLIHSSWGGTAVEAWTSGPSLALTPDFADYVEQLKQVPTDPVEQKEYLDREMELYNQYLKDKDRGFSQNAALYAQENLDDKDWNTLFVPENWEKQALKEFDGVVWYRRQIDLPASLAGKDLTISLGTIDDNDITYVNGQQVGATEGWNLDRVYTIPGKLVKAGKNTITVRVLDTSGGGGFYGDPAKVFISGNGLVIKLSGDWKYRIGFNMNDINKIKVIPGQVQPSTLFNGMINPLIPYAIKGAIWYQGEANVGRAEQYKRLFPLMIHDWRTGWKSDFPFYFVQLANYLQHEDSPVKAPWAELREAQEQALTLTNTGMATTIDIGNGADIHPKNKQDVGRRLALAAATGTYGKKLVSGGPRYESFKIDGSEIIISFSSVGSGLKVAAGNKITGFAIAGVDKKFHWANARISGNQIILSAPGVEFPVAARYAWANNPECNLYNQEDLPAVPFRTDNWDN